MGSDYKGESSLSIRTMNNQCPPKTPKCGAEKGQTHMTVQPQKLGMQIRLKFNLNSSEFVPNSNSYEFVRIQPAALTVTDCGGASPSPDAWDIFRLGIYNVVYNLPARRTVGRVPQYNLSSSPRRPPVYPKVAELSGPLT
jgi:hypothetical protein